MTRTLDNSIILIVTGRSLSTFRLQRALEREGAAVCVTTVADARHTLRHTRPDAVVMDFSVVANCDDLADDLEDRGVVHLVCGSPSLQQELGEQISAAQDVAAWIADLVARGTSVPLRGRPAIDADLYAM